MGFRFRMAVRGLLAIKREARVCFCETPCCDPSRPDRFTQDAGVIKLNQIGDMDSCDAGWGKDILGRGSWNVSNKFAQATFKKDGSVKARGDLHHGGNISM